MKRIAAVVTLTLAWLVISGDLSPVNVVLGLLVTSTTLYLVRFVGVHETPRLRALPALGFVAWYGVHVLQGAWVVGKETVRVRRRLDAAIVKVPVHVRTRWELAMLASLVTFVPGTITVEVSPDRQLMYVHGICQHSEHEIVEEVERLQRRFMEVLH